MNTSPGLYVHFPWCVRKCPYCDFNSHPLRGSLDEAGYLQALQEDAAAALRQTEPGTFGSVFLGGGTPSLFSPETLGKLLAELGPWLRPDAEITMEANPGTVEYHDFHAYRAAGINRVSLGAQSFDERQLSRLGRIHGPGEISLAVRRIREGGIQNINLDLMYALPEQTAEDALDDLEQALALSPEHISWYQLTIEAKTEFARRPPVLPVESEVDAMERAGRELLAGRGFERYEVSAYARPGYRARHNLNYWTFGDYLGIGAGAHGKQTSAGADGLQVVRTSKAAQPRLYLAAPASVTVVVVPEGEIAVEFLMNALRLAEGVAPDCFTQRTGLPLSRLEPTWSQLVQMGLMREDRIATTEVGYQHLDAVLQRFL